MAVIASLLARLGLDSSGFEEGSKKAQKSLKQMVSEIQRTNQTLATLSSLSTGFSVIKGAVMGVYGELKKLTDAAVEAQQAQFKMTAALSFGGANAAQIAGINATIDALVKKTTYEREAIREAVAYGASIGIGADQMEAATKMALGLATATGRDLHSGMSLVKAALEGDVLRMKDYGIVVDANTTKQEAWNRVVDVASRGLKTEAERIGAVSGEIINAAKDIDMSKKRIGEVLLPLEKKTLSFAAGWLEEASRIPETAKAVAAAISGRDISGAPVYDVAAAKRAMESRKFWKEHQDILDYAKAAAPAPPPEEKPLEGLRITGLEQIAAEEAAKAAKDAAEKRAKAIEDAKKSLADMHTEMVAQAEEAKHGADNWGEIQARAKATDLALKASAGDAAKMAEYMAQFKADQEAVVAARASVELNKQMEAMEAQARAALEVTGSWKQTKEYADAQVLAIKAANGDLELQKSLMERIAHDRAMIEQSERLKKSYDTMRESWISNMDAMALSGQSFGDTMKNIFQDIVKEAYNMIIVENAAKSFAGGVTNILGSVMRGAAQSTIPAGAVTSHSGKYMHEGGVVPRLHNGLGPNEVPAILERGEAVVPKGGLNSMFTIVNQSSAPVKGRMMNQSFDGRRVVTSIILEDLDSNGPVSQKLGR